MCVSLWFYDWNSNCKLVRIKLHRILPCQLLQKCEFVAYLISMWTLTDCTSADFRDKNRWVKFEPQSWEMRPQHLDNKYWSNYRSLIHSTIYSFLLHLYKQLSPWRSVLFVITTLPRRAEPWVTLFVIASFALSVWDHVSFRNRPALFVTRGLILFSM